MLMLGRRKDEVIIIGEGDSQIRVTVVDIVGNRVRLGIQAPPEVRILRGEIEEAKEFEKSQKSS